MQNNSWQIAETQIIVEWINNFSEGKCVILIIIIKTMNENK